MHGQKPKRTRCRISLNPVYDHLLKLARACFLLADDAGAGKTIIAGLLIRELKLRGMCERILIVAPSNLAFQWQRELQGEVRREVLRHQG
jgi:SNF2 family DNA or RNA helicase